jgi:ABC-type glutathione transport system ATPase component
MHIAIVGNIGAGKTTLTGLLAKHYGSEALYEAVDNNPYLEDFYSDMKRWSFNLQIYFLNSRFQQIVDIQNFNRNVIQDRTIYEDAHIFADNLHEMGLMIIKTIKQYSLTSPHLLSHQTYLSTSGHQFQRWLTTYNDVVANMKPASELITCLSLMKNTKSGSRTINWENY